MSQPRLEHITPAIGSYVRGVDLAAPQPDDVIASLRRDLHERGVLVFRDQEAVTPERQKAFASRFGPLWVHPFGTKHPDHPELLVFTETTATRTIGWHVDGSFDERPIYASILRAVELPSGGGGDTLWASAVAAYAALSPALRTFVDGLSAEHAIRTVHGGGGEAYDVGSGEGTSAVHPVVGRDPLTGRRYLFVNPLYTTRILELSPAESDAVLAFLFAHIVSPNFQVRVKWEPGTIVFWNNVLTHHFATNDYDGERRIVHRATVGGQALVDLRERLAATVGAPSGATSTAD